MRKVLHLDGLLAQIALADHLVIPQEVLVGPYDQFANPLAKPRSSNVVLTDHTNVRILRPCSEAQFLRGIPETMDCRILVLR